MTKYLVTRHCGKRLGEYATQDAAIAAANADAERYGHRCNVYPIISDAYPGQLGVRIVSCYPRAMIWEADIADLPHHEYMAAHRNAS